MEKACKKKTVLKAYGGGAIFMPKYLFFKYFYGFFLLTFNLTIIFLHTYRDNQKTLETEVDF